MRGEGTVAEVLAGDARFAVVCGDAVEVLRAVPDGCAHVCYCDPPYGLSEQRTRDVVECLRAWLAGEVYTHGRDGFMSASWDAFVPGPEAWREVFRALKPGAYCVAFSSTRTVDLLGIAVRLAGFEQREGWAWVTGQAFPKSLDVSKAIDAAEGAEREVVGESATRIQLRDHPDAYGGWGAKERTEGGGVPITAPATHAAAQWSGYGTTLKPSHEPLVVAMKPLDFRSLLAIIGSKVCEYAASHAGPTSTSSRRESQEASGSAPSGASRRQEQGGSSGQTATSPCGSEDHTSSNIASSWLAILAELSVHANTFTIETAASLTTDLRILSSLLSRITQENTSASAPRDQASDSRSSVEAAGRMFSAIDLKLRAIRELSATETATASTPTCSPARAEQTRSNGGFEPIVVARKPLDGTVAANVQRHGCGALNIDAGRIAAGGPSPSVERRESAARSGWDNRGGGIMDDRTDPARYSAPHAGEQLGRFPASLALVHSEGCERVGVRRVRGNTPFGQAYTSSGGVLNVQHDRPRETGAHTHHADADGMETVDEWRCVDGCAAKVLGEQSGESASSVGKPRGAGHGEGWGMTKTGAEHSDHGTAARFFFNAKASSASRLAFVTCTPGCAAHETVIGAREARARSTCPACGGARTKHEHATVKPLDLARYHARLLSLPAHVAPVALVPFCGTGVEARALLEVGFRVIAVDLDARHCAMTRHRLAQPLDAEAPQPRRKAPPPPPAQPQPVAVAPVAAVPAAVSTPPKPQRRTRVAAGQLDLFGDGAR